MNATASPEEIRAKLDAFDDLISQWHPEQIRQVYASIDRAIEEQGGWSMMRPPDDIGCLIMQWGICRTVYERKTGKSLW